MLYAMTEELGKAISATGCSQAKVIVFDDRVEICLTFEKTDKKTETEKKDKAVKKKKTEKNKRSYAGKSVAEWAKSLGVSERAIKYRLTVNGTPFSKEDKPEDKDKVMLA